MTKKSEQHEENMKDNKEQRCAGACCRQNTEEQPCVCGHDGACAGECENCQCDRKKEGCACEDNTSDDLKRLLVEKEEYKVQAQRAMADYQNLQRRVAEERTSIGQFATQMLVSDLVPALDHLDLAINTAPEDEHKSSWFQAATMSVKQIKDVLAKAGVTEINPENEVFDPNHHEAVDVVDGDEDDKITKVHAKGYAMHGKVIRPARVQVSKKS